MSTLSDISVPDIPPLSPGSSVSTRLQDEYDELLKFAVVVPKYDPRGTSHTLTDARESFLQRDISAGSLEIPRRLVTDTREEDECSEATDVTPINPRSPRERLPDFGGHSPIRREPGGRERDQQQQGPPSLSSSERLSTRARPPARELQMEQGEYERVYTATVDPDVAKMETMMDQWCLDLKRNVLAEFSQSKIRIVEQGRQQLVREQEKHASEKMRLVEEMNGLKELLATYERSIERKDQVISNLTSAMQKQRDKMEMARTFCEWKIKHNDCKREIFTAKLAKQHYERRLCGKAWDAWHGVIQSRWRQRAEKACQAKAQEVCLQLTSEYEAKLRQANEALGVAQAEVAGMQKERERYEEMMKKAFMRGVCALNLEAMTIFHNGEEKENQGDTDNRAPDVADNLMASLAEKDYSKSLAHDQMSGVSVQRHERIVTSEGSRPSSASQAKPQNTRATKSSKVLTTKVTAKVDTGKGKTADKNSLAPPMSSVIVERHQPVTKQTMPHALAEKFPKSSSAYPGPNQQRGAHRKIAGQGPLPVTTNIHTIKHVD